MNDTTHDDTVRWKDLIDIPEAQDTFVLQLSEGIDARQQTVDSYVVTDSLERRFDQALDLIEDGLAVGRPGDPESQGAFLHGSFGSGKSHFMAMLNLLLEGYGPARDMEGLRGVAAEHEWMDDHDLLTLPFHMLDKDSMEQAVLGSYVEYVDEHHPEARTPGVYVAENILKNADQLREQFGDENFFDSLNEGATAADGGWGEYGTTTWDAEAYEEVRELPATHPRKEKLVGAVIDNLLSALPGVSHAEGEGYVNFDEGLSIISRHAREELGYDGILLFLDELILWLSRGAANPDFVSSEIQKVAKLVEAQHHDRPAPIFSFIARQRDLSKMIGDKFVGQAQQQLSLHEDLLEGRFHTIELEDRNLPDVAQARLLDPIDEEAKRQIDASFEQKMSELTDTEREIMLTERHDREDFRKVYPFSPALVEALIILSNELQRSRTALKIMQILLMRQRDELELGELIPVGDLWSVLVEGETPMDQVKAKLFEKADQVDRHQIQPQLREDHEVESLEVLDPDDLDDRNTRQAYLDDQRLLHTLLVAALLQEMPMFESITPERLVALNHGTVEAFVPQAAADQIKPKLNQWSVKLNNLHLSQGHPPEVEIRLEGVDIEPLIQKANAQDNHGARMRRMRGMIYEALGADDPSKLRWTRTLEWRGDTREVDVKFSNVRELQLRDLEPDEPDQWLVLLDCPFDEGDYTPRSDHLHLTTYRKERGESADTIVWLPRFLNADGRDLVGRLIKVESVLEQFDSYASDLSSDNRPVARRQLENTRESILEHLHSAVRTAYGLGSQSRELLADEMDVPRLQSLRAGFEPSKPPHGKSFEEALEATVREGLEHKYPDAPRFPDERLSTNEVETMHEVIRDAVHDEQDSTHVGRRAVRRRLQQYAEKLSLGVMGENRFELNHHWPDRVRQHVDLDDEAGVEVGAIYQLLDPDEARTGLADHLKDLVVLAVADMEDMVIRRHDRPIDPSPGALKARDVLVPSDLPDEEAWETAKRVADQVFGVRRLEMLHSNNVQELVDRMEEAADSKLIAGRQLPDELHQVGRRLGSEDDDIEETRRWQVADKLRKILLALDHDRATEVVEAIGEVDVEADLGPIERIWDEVDEHVDLLERRDWKVFANVVDQGDEAKAEARRLLDNARRILSEPEHSANFEKLEDLRNDLLDVVMERGDEPGGGDGTTDDSTPDTEVDVSKRVTERSRDTDSSPEVSLETTAGSLVEDVRESLDEKLDVADDTSLRVTIDITNDEEA